MLELALNVVLSVAGFVLLIKCADFLVDGAASLAKKLKISTAVIGLTIVAFGTSAPELAISFNSHFHDNTDMMLGNVFGSNITNILVILGIAVLIKPFKVSEDVMTKQIPILLLATLCLSTLFLDGLFDSAAMNTLSRADGIILLLLFSVFVYFIVTILKNRKDGTEEEEIPQYSLPKSILMIIGGLIGIVLGSELVVHNVSAFATAIGISQKIIAITVVAIGTSLPELVVTIIAAKKGENCMAIGNIVGSNIFNTCIVLGMPIAVLGGVSTASFSVIDTIFMVLAVALLWAFLAIDKRELKRRGAIVFIAVYCLYLGYIFMQ
jgi:cation:H+ antiporter